MAITHTFTSVKTDGADPAQVQPSSWNADHAVDVITLPTQAGTPASPPAGNLTVFSRSIAGRMMLAQVGPSGLDTSLQPFLARNKIGYWCPSGNSTTAPGVFGLSALSAVGTATPRSVTAASGPARMRRIGYVSAATAGALAGHRLPFLQFTGGSGINDGSGFMLVARFVMSDAAVVSGKRAFVGMIGTGGAPINVEPSTLKNCLGIAQLSGDANQWYLCYGGTTSQASIPLGTALGSPAGLSSDAFDLVVFAPNSTANTFYVQVTNIFTGVSVSYTLSGDATVIPQSNTLLAYTAWACNNATLLAAGIDICSVYIETDT